MRFSHQEGEWRGHPEIPPPMGTGMCWSNARLALSPLGDAWVRRQTSPSCSSQEHPSPRLLYSLAHWLPGGRCIQACPGASWKRVLMRDESCPRPQRPAVLRFLPKSLWGEFGSSASWVMELCNGVWTGNRERRCRNRDEWGSGRASPPKTVTTCGTCLKKYRSLSFSLDLLNQNL